MTQDGTQKTRDKYCRSPDASPRLLQVIDQVHSGDVRKHQRTHQIPVAVLRRVTGVPVVTSEIDGVDINTV